MLAPLNDAKAAQITFSAKNKSVREVIKEIEKISDYRFFYNDDLRGLNAVISVNVEEGDIDKMMDQITRQTGISYIVRENNQVVLSSKATAVPQQKDANRKVVTGIVTDTSGEPVIGANVMEKGAANGTITDVDGRFSLTVPADAVLQVSYIGYLTSETAVNGRTSVDIRIEENSQSLNEVVVVGYGVQKKVNLSGAVQAVSGAAISNRPITNVNRGLQGLVPNLNITNLTGRADAAPEINIRGFTSINGGEAFILVDNVPVSSNELSRINPDDIENVSVLKDASSAAIYGARAAFGVVLITTKKANRESSDLKVNFSGNYAVRDRGIRPEIVTDIVQVMETKNLARTPLSPLFSQAQLEYARKLAADPSLGRVIPDPTNPNQWAYFGQTDWVKEGYKEAAPSYTANINISKWDEKLSYYVSGGYYKEDGLLRYGNDNMQRYNFRAKGDMALTSWWKVGSNISYVNTVYDSPSFLDGYFNWNINRIASTEVPKNPDGTWTSSGASLLGAIREGGRRNDRRNETQLSFTTQVDLIKDVWTLNADVNFRRTNFNRDKYNLPVPYRTGPNQPIMYSLSDRGSTSYTEFTAREDRYDIYNVYSNFTKTFGRKHFFNAMIGYNSELTSLNTYATRKDLLISSALPEINLATGATTASNSRRELALQGIFGRVNYIFDNRYIVEFNGRYDGSSRFPAGDRYGFFPSASAGWLVVNEKFFAGIADKLDISNLKLRASYGLLGNQTIFEGETPLYYPYIPYMSSDKTGQALDGDRPVYVKQPGVVSPSLTWEKVRTINGGIDIGLFNGRFDASFDYYVRYTDDMLTYSKELPAVFGAKAPKTNAANLKTQGWELSAGWRDRFMLANSPFNWSVKLMLADSKSFITKFDNPSKLLSNYYEGQQIGEIWGFVNDGFFQSEEELKKLDQSAVGTDDQSYKFYVGDTRFKDLNGDNKIDFGDKTVDKPGDRKIIGNTEVRFPYSFELYGDWKGFDLRAFFQGIGKRDWYPAAASIYFWGVYAQPWTNVTKKNLDHWTPEKPDGYFPRMKAYIAEDPNEELSAPQTKYLQDASYLRLKNLTLGYTLPKALLNRARIENLRVYFSAENVLTFSHLDKDIDLDPEIVHKSYNGSNSGTYPMQRTYSLGLNITF
jgi:TonB-linked SusC/RagA family outer membrane protein